MEKESKINYNVINNFFNDIGFNESILEPFNTIYVLVSGGFDSTLLYEFISNSDLLKSKNIFAVNCFNPYENSDTLNDMKKLKNFIEIKSEMNYMDILKRSFMKLSAAFELYKERKYYKKIFECCYFIKHKAFLDNPLFLKDDCVVISGIKYGDGKQRRIFLYQLAKGMDKISTSNTNNNYYYNKDGISKPTFFHKHKSGQIYCYPFRDYKKKELPDYIKEELKKKYKTIDHSGCALCPVLILNSLTEEKRYNGSLYFAKKLGLENLVNDIIEYNLIHKKKNKNKNNNSQDHENENYNNIMNLL